MLNIKYQNGLDAIFVSSPFQKEIEEGLDVVDSCGQSICVEIHSIPPDAVTLTLRKSSGGIFFGTPGHGEYILERSAYEGNEEAQDKGRSVLKAFVEIVQSVLNQ